MSENITLEPGMTCRIGKAKNAMEWEILAVEGPNLRVSKLGGDGYVNKWEQPHTINRVMPRLLDVSLSEVLALREALRRHTSGLENNLRGVTPDRVMKSTHAIREAAIAFATAAHAYRAGINHHYPHLKEA